MLRYIYLKLNINEDLSKKFFGSFNDKLLTLYKNNPELLKYTLNIYWDNKKNQAIVTVLGNGELLISLGYKFRCRKNRIFRKINQLNINFMFIV